jgi:hypothetical protein
MIPNMETRAKVLVLIKWRPPSVKDMGIDLCSAWERATVHRTQQNQFLAV